MSQLAIGLPPHPPAYGREDFIVSASNRHAYDMVVRWPHWVEPFMSVVGPRHAGKSHLAHIWAEQAKARFVPIDQLATHSSQEWLEGHDALVLEDVEQLHDEEALFHLLNHVRSEQTWLLLTSQQPLNRLPIALPDLRSRMAAIAFAELQQPDDMVMRGILMKQFADRQIRVSPDIIDFILRRCERSAQALADLVVRLDEQAMAQQRAITLPLVREVMQEWSTHG